MAKTHLLRKNQFNDDVDVVVLRRHEQGVVGRRLVEVGTRTDQYPDNIDVAVMSRHEQRGRVGVGHRLVYRGAANCSEDCANEGEKYVHVLLVCIQAHPPRRAELYNHVESVSCSSERA